MKSGECSTVKKWCMKSNLIALIVVNMILCHLSTLKEKKYLYFSCGCINYWDWDYIESHLMYYVCCYLIMHYFYNQWNENIFSTIFPVFFNYVNRKWLSHYSTVQHFETMYKRISLNYEVELIKNPNVKNLLN